MHRLLAIIGSVILCTAIQAKGATATDECEAKWPGNYQMQEYCGQQQSKALHDMSDWLKRFEQMGADGRIHPQGIAGEIFNSCLRQWHTNYEMVLHCATEQEEAATRLGKFSPPLPEPFREDELAKGGSCTTAFKGRDDGSNGRLGADHEEMCGYRREFQK